jgi:nicotinate-nucleotide adenylyltransferase
MQKRIGLFGGSFDPIHMGHLLLAELCREALSLDKVLFIVANISPLKMDRHSASNRDRLEMVKLATNGNPRFEVEACEIERGGVSYSVDTTRWMAQKMPGSELYFLMGADVLEDLERWREPRELFRISTPAVIARAGFGEPDWERLSPYVDAEKLLEIKNAKVGVPLLEISSSDLKSRIRNGKSIRYQTPASVEVYIREQHLYVGD